MSKNIKITDESLNEVRKAFEEALSTGKFSDGKITFTKTLGIVNRKATVFFTELAWIKMQALIREFDKEVAWHGVAKRGEDASKDEYYITDILVYPQKVTGAAVTTDQNRYQMWLYNHEDEVFNNIRMQGHSHVNMEVAPSGVDLSFYDRVLEQLEDNMFFIFMIWNKRGEKTIKIYDFNKNILFDTSDVTVEVLDDGTGIKQFLKDAKDAVKDKPTTPTSTYQSPYRGSYGYGGYYGGYGSSYGGSSKEEKPKKTEPPKETASSQKKRKGKRKGKKHGGVNNACNESTQVTLWDGYDYDDMDDPFYARGY